MSKIYRQCQSCGMPLNNGENCGTEADGSICNKYCNYCYNGGQFTDPNATLESMKKLVREVKGVNPLLKWLGVMQLPSLERWRAK